MSWPDTLRYITKNFTTFAELAEKIQFNSQTFTEVSLHFKKCLESSLSTRYKFNEKE